MTKRKAEKLARECVRFYLEDHDHESPINPKSMYAFYMFKQYKRHVFLVGCWPVKGVVFIVQCEKERVYFDEFKIEDFAFIYYEDMEAWKNENPQT